MCLSLAFSPFAATSSLLIFLLFLLFFFLSTFFYSSFLLLPPSLPPPPPRLPFTHADPVFLDKRDTRMTIPSFSCLWILYRSTWCSLRPSLHSGLALTPSLLPPSPALSRGGRFDQRSSSSDTWHPQRQSPSTTTHLPSTFSESHRTRNGHHVRYSSSASLLASHSLHCCYLALLGE